MAMKEYPETHQRGIISLENVPTKRMMVGDLGIQIADDGRVWVCIDGVALIRFNPRGEEYLDKAARELL